MRAFAASAAMALLAGCATPPGSRASLPEPSLPAQFKVGAGFETPAPTEDSTWWHELSDPILSALVGQALERNSDVEAALARVAESRALVEAGRSTRYPRVDAAASVSRSRASLEDPARSPAAGRTGSRWSADARVSWETDLFGRRDAESRALTSRAEAREAHSEAVRLTVVADVLSRAFELAALDERMQLAAQALAVEQDLVTLAQAKAASGQVSELDVSKARTQLSRSKATVVQLRLRRADTLAALAVLLSVTPDEVDIQVRALQLPTGTLPSLALAAPSEMLLGRPDVRVAAAELRAISADLAGIAAERYPRFDIGATLGWVASNITGLGSANALAASLLPGARWRALDFGELDARLASRKATERAAAAEYKAAVTRAFVEAQTALLQLEHQRALMEAAQDSQRAGDEVCQVQRARYAAGASDMAAALEGCKALQAAAEALVDARRDAMLGRVLVHKALGTGATRVAAPAVPAG